MSTTQFSHIIFGVRYNFPMNLPFENLKELFSEEALTKKENEFKEIPIDSILAVLERTGDIFSNRESRYYKTAMAKLPKLINYAPSMVAVGLDMLPFLLSRESSQARLKCLGNYKALDYFVSLKHEIYRRAMPVGAVCHIAAGNVFLGSIDSLLYGIITKNINLLKISKQDPVFPTLFFEALQEADTENIVMPYIAMTYWDRTNTEATNFIKNTFEAILLFSGQQAVIEYKSGLSFKTELIAFGPKISFSIITKDLSQAELQIAAKGLASDIVLWEQRACTSCQNIFIEQDENSDYFISQLVSELEKISKIFPQTALDVDSKVDIRKVRELAKWNEFSGKGRLFEGDKTDYTVLVTHNSDITDSPLNRTVIANIVDSYKSILDGTVKYLKYYMSTIAIAGHNSLEIIEAFTKLGVMRFCKPGTMALGADMEAPHDGLFIPEQLIRFISLDDLPSSEFGFAYLKPEQRDKYLLANLNNLLLDAQKSPFYQKKFKDIPFKVSSLEEYAALPCIEKRELAANCPPKSLSMLTEKPKRAYIFSAGGTTGLKKYVYYSADEFARSAKYFGQGFKAAGITQEDIVANFFNPGALWTAFPATNIALEETGCTILSLTANQSMEMTLNYLKEFKANVILGITGSLVLLAEKAEELGLNISLDKVLFSGEPMPESAEKYLKKVFNAKKVNSLGYAAVEVGPIGYQCEHCEPNEYHIFDDFCYTEIADDGNIIITTLGRKLHPLIRFKVGDRGEKITAECKCGRHTAKIKLLARMDDMIKLTNTEIFLSEIFDAVGKHSTLSSFFQILVSSLNGKTDLVFRIESSRISELPATTEFVESVKQSIILSCGDMRDDWDNFLVKDFKVEIVAPLAIERVGRTGKIKRIVDTRQER